MVKFNVHVRFGVQRFVHKYRLNNALCLCKATTSRIYCCPRIKTQFELFQRTPHCVVCCDACKCIFKQFYLYAVIVVLICFLSFKSQKPDFTQIKYTFSFALGKKKTIVICDVGDFAQTSRNLILLFQQKRRKSNVIY